jgi:hypothetical protein
MEEKFTIDEQGLERRYSLLSEETLDTFEEILSESRHEIPGSLGEIPPSLRLYEGFKTAEWKSFLEIYGPSLLHGHLPQDVHRNLCTLSELWGLATKSCLDALEQSQISQLVTEFVQGYGTIYYHNSSTLPSFEFCWLKHLSQQIRENGPPCYWWSWQLERVSYTFIHPVRESFLSTLFENSTG